ncbi:hypothetical protein O3M35_011784 [Rhynocoris fuscipes]|uniref:Uncharacterized protein n=1 Tax=Rhynocoris fuscipes TaxID=488301 RepID=A0AAW1CXH7_9HEMI
MDISNVTLGKYFTNTFEALLRNYLKFSGVLGYYFVPKFFIYYMTLCCACDCYVQTQIALKFTIEELQH